MSSSTACTASTADRDCSPVATGASRRTFWITDLPAMRSQTQISAVAPPGTIANVATGSSSRPEVSSAVRTSTTGSWARMLTSKPAAASSPRTRASASVVTSSVIGGRSSTTR